MDYKDVALFIVRLAVGSTFLLHGAQKLLGLFGGPGLNGFVQWIATFGMPAWFAYCGAFGEFFGALMVFSGVGVRLGAAILLVDMAVAIYLVHWTKGYFIQNGGFEYPLNLILLCIALIVGGGGMLSVW